MKNVQACEWAQTKKIWKHLRKAEKGLKKGWKTLNKLKKLQFSTTKKIRNQIKIWDFTGLKVTLRSLCAILSSTDYNEVVIMGDSPLFFIFAMDTLIGTTWYFHLSSIWLWKFLNYEYDIFLLYTNFTHHLILVILGKQNMKSNVDAI